MQQIDSIKIGSIALERNGNSGRKFIALLIQVTTRCNAIHKQTEILFLFPLKKGVLIRFRCLQLCFAWNL